MLLEHSVAVLLEEAVDPVFDTLGEVVHNEGALRHARLGEVTRKRHFGGRCGGRIAPQMLLVEFAAPCGVAALGHLALLVEQVEYAEFALDELDARLIVVELDERPLDLLAHVLLLLELEHVLTKET